MVMNFAPIFCHLQKAKLEPETGLKRRLIVGKDQTPSCVPIHESAIQQKMGDPERFGQPKFYRDM